MCTPNTHAWEAGSCRALLPVVASTTTTVVSLEEILCALRSTAAHTPSAPPNREICQRSQAARPATGSEVTPCGRGCLPHQPGQPGCGRHWAVLAGGEIPRGWSTLVISITCIYICLAVLPAGAAPRSTESDSASSLAVKAAARGFPAAALRCQLRAQSPTTAYLLRVTTEARAERTIPATAPVGAAAPSSGLLNVVAGVPVGGTARDTRPLCRTVPRALVPLGP